MADEHERIDEPKEDEREETISDLEPSDEEAEDVKGGSVGSNFRKVDG